MFRSSSAHSRLFLYSLDASLLPAGIFSSQILIQSPEALVITFAKWKMAAIGIYLVIGAVFAVAFLTAGIARVDPAAKGAPIGFRLLIFPGVVAFWPYLLSRWIGGGRAPRIERNSHRDAAGRAQQ
jgi:hypothetical protein